MRHTLLSLPLVVTSLLTPLSAAGQSRREALRSAPIERVRYELTFDRSSAGRRAVQVAMRFVARGRDPVLLSLPAWTPGAYEVSYFARKVSAFRATAGTDSLRWDKVDWDTWRVWPRGAGEITVAFEVLADELDNAMAWAQPDFLMVNGTTVFPYPEGRRLDFPATVTVHTEADWLVATGMRSGGAPRAYRETSYHDVVDMPLFVGRIDLDSVEQDGRWLRLATWPAGVLGGEARAALWREIQAVIPPMRQVFGEIPWDGYTTLLLFPEGYGGGSALEHQNSHVGIYDPGLIGSPILTNITAHEIFHAWNVKRLRPAELVPYRYDAPQPTPLLWVSEGFTNYYADLAMARGGLLDAAQFTELASEHVRAFWDAPPVALEDASLSTWIRPTDGTAYLYYDKGGVVAWLLDILIREATHNRAALDDVLHDLYQRTYRRGRGFTTDEFFATASRIAGRSFDAFRARYVDGREPLPLADVLPLAGWRWVVTERREPRLGIQTIEDSTGIAVALVQPGGAADEAGLMPGDRLVRLGELEAGPGLFAAFRERYRGEAGARIPVVVRRGEVELTLAMPVRLVVSRDVAVALDEAAPERARRIRAGILRGVTESSR
jgi:predicted metalloprotease with PDZ domain